MSTIPGGEQDWVGIRYRDADRKRGKTGRSLMWHVIAGIVGGNTEQFRMRCGFVRHHVKSFAHVELAGPSVWPAALDGVKCDECFALTPPPPKTYIGLTEDDIERLAHRIVELARESEDNL